MKDFKKEEFLKDLVSNRNEDLQQKYNLSEEEFRERKIQAIMKASEQTLLELQTTPHQKIAKGKDGNVIIKNGEVLVENDIQIMEIKKEIATYMLDRIGRKEYSKNPTENPTENFDGFVWGEPLPPQEHEI